MGDFVFKSLKSAIQRNFGLGVSCEKNFSALFGFGRKYFASPVRCFKFLNRHKFSAGTGVRIEKSLKDLVLLNSSKYNAILKKNIQRRIAFLKFNRSWRGVQHFYSLPVRGQRTKTNARTRKFNKNKKI